MTPTKRPLDFFLNEELGWERQLVILLKQSIAETERIMRELAKKNGPGALQRGYQLQSAQIEMKRELANLWAKIGHSITAGRENTAAAAIDAAYNNTVLKRVPGMTDQLLKGMQAGERAAAKQNIARSIARLQGRGYVPLSTRVYKSGELVTGRVDRVVNLAIARGSSARELATAVSSSINPNTPGGVSYAAKRLGRTELNNSFHAAQTDYARDTPWVTGMVWKLSGSHKRADECDDYADTTFAPADVPAKPHPQCLCFMIDKTMPFTSMMNDPASQAHIDDLMRQAGYDDSYIALSAA